MVTQGRHSETAEKHRNIFCRSTIMCSFLQLW